MKSPSKFYKEDLKNLLKSLVPKCSTHIQIINEIPQRKFDYIFIPNTFSFLDDTQDFLKRIKTNNCYEDSRVVIIYFNFLWKSILDLTTFIGLRKKVRKEPNWLTSKDIDNIFKLEGFEKIRSGKRLLLPLDFGILSTFINKYIAQLPLINNLCLTCYRIYRPVKKTKEYSVSIIIPARNEQGNITDILNKLPVMGNKTEVIFVEGHSKDNTYEVIKEEISRCENKNVSARLFKQKGTGKANAVRLGFQKAKNDILIILDADLTVTPKDLEKFYNALANGVCDFANGSRLVYPLEKDSMMLLNYMGNSFFSTAFTYLIGQHVKDTLCGTKALFKKDYERIAINRREFGNFDPFGDFDLLFGATKLNLKICDIPVRYHERVYGKTNISRFVHGWLLVKMTIFAAKKIKFI